MKYLIVLLSLIFINCSITSNQNDWQPIPDGSFKKDQLRYGKVREAYKNKSTYIKNLLLSKGINSYEFELFIRSFKNEKQLEVWIKHKTFKEYILLKTYTHCAASGKLGPKRMQGDAQVPEGFYYIDRFNPASSYHLSLGINYPNASDKILGKKSSLGGNIFIHGNCLSLGCIAITDPMIEELYILSIEAKTQGQSKIPVHIFPTRNMKFSCTDNSTNKDFWCTLNNGYQKFNLNKTTIPSPKINSNGTYTF